MYSEPPSFPWTVFVILLLWAATGLASALDDEHDEARVCSLGWTLNAFTLFVQFWLLFAVSVNRNFKPYRFVAGVGRWVSALASACQKSAKSIFKCRAVRFQDLFKEARANEENKLDLQQVMSKGTSYLEECSVDWLFLSLPEETSPMRLYLVRGMYLGGDRLESSDAKLHAMVFNRQKQDSQSCSPQKAINLRGTKRMGSWLLHLIMTTNVLLAVLNTVGALLWMIKLPNIVGAAYATSRLGMKAMGLGYLQWMFTRLPHGFYLLEGADLEVLQARYRTLDLMHIWNLSDLCGESAEGGKCTWWLAKYETKDTVSRVMRGGLLWSKAPRWVEYYFNYPYVIPAACAGIGYVIFVWPYCWVAAMLIVPMGMMETMNKAQQSASWQTIYELFALIVFLVVIMFYDMFIVAAGYLYTGASYWEAVRRTYDAGDTECVLRDSFATAVEFMTLN